MVFTELSFMTAFYFSSDSTIHFLFIISLSFFFFLFWCVCAYKQEEKRKRKGRRRWEKWVCDSLTWCLMTEICAPNLSFFFPSIPFSNLDPIPLHCSYHCNFFILLLLLPFSCVFSFFTANALQLCAFNFVSFKFSYLIFSQWCQMVRWNYETLKSVEYFSNFFLVSIHFHQSRGLCS